MKSYKLVVTPFILKTPCTFIDALDVALEKTIQGLSLRDALQKFVKAPEFDEYIGKWSSVWVYRKSHSGYIYFVPAYFDIEI